MWSEPRTGTARRCDILPGEHYSMTGSAKRSSVDASPLECRGGFVRGPLVLVGPSGAGKTTIAARLVKRHTGRFALSVSVTTRRPRPGEEDGRDYHFVSRRDFDEMIRAGELAEWAEVHGERYGTPAANLVPVEGDGPVTLLDIDVQGARQVMGRAASALVIFILPPGPGEWIGRLAGRGTESPREIARRLRTALRELAGAPFFDQFVVNADLDRAVDEVLALVEGAGPDRSGSRGFASLRHALDAGARSGIERLEAAAGAASADQGV